MIDWDRVFELRDEIGADGFSEIAVVFLEEVEEVILRLSAEAGAKAVEADLHFLKGSALNLGFADFAALCQEGERLAATGSTAVDLEAVRRSYAASRTIFERDLDQAMEQREAS